jgi:ABC-type phosphate/phosphonate transport system substrate-binding protein
MIISQAQPYPRYLLPILTLLFMLPIQAKAEPTKITVLRLASTSTMTGKPDSAREKAGNETLRKFIKEETGLTSEIVGREKWEPLAEMLTKGQVHIGVFQGYEFAWLQEKYPKIKPLALGINGYRYPSVYVLARQDNQARDFVDLKGQTLAVPGTSAPFVNLFMERSCEAQKNTMTDFFTRVTTTDNIEDTIDDLVDGKFDATALDQASFEAYKRRKPGRVNKLKVVARSNPMPPVVVAYSSAILDENTRARFQEGLLTASKKEKGGMLLTLSRLTAFEPVGDDFGKILKETRTSFPEK